MQNSLSQQLSSNLHIFLCFVCPCIHLIKGREREREREEGGGIRKTYLLPPFFASRWISNSLNHGNTTYCTYSMHGLPATSWGGQYACFIFFFTSACVSKGKEIIKQKNLLIVFLLGFAASSSQRLDYRLNTCTLLELTTVHCLLLTTNYHTNSLSWTL